VTARTTRYTDGVARKRVIAETARAEVGAFRKEHGGRLRVALCYPNHYRVGMANLGLQTMYRLFNARDDVVCERAFLPDDSTGSDGATPFRLLRTLESGTPLAEMDVIAFSVSFELDFANIPRMLRLGGVEPFAAQRRGPQVIAGGAAISGNPEPVAPFLDAAVIGEGEEIIPALVEALHSRNPAALAVLPGVYVPAHHEAGETPALPAPVQRLVVADVNREPIYTQVYAEGVEFGDMTLVEVGRGCPYGCAFCFASHAYRPARWRAAATLLPVITRSLQVRQRVGLVGASVTDHPDILPLCEAILAQGGQIAPASMRADALTDDLLALLARGGVRSITLAPEAGTEALRRAAGKRLRDDSLFAAAARARAAGIRALKLYFIIGLPGETEDDVAAIPALALRLAHESGLRVSVGCSVLVPKPATPWARVAMLPEREAKRRLETVRLTLGRAVDFTGESPRWATWQGVLARGGRELAPVLAGIAEGPDTPAAWAAAFRAHGVDAGSYVRAYAADEALPWEGVICGRAASDRGV
jgi:radical SAM superfamily enzyme YgiQ (UPF0313 family)